jgi:hypothetical protein
MSANPLAGLPLHYLIGAADPGQGAKGVVTEVPYDWNRPVAYGVSVGYCNLFDETSSGHYGPYLKAEPGSTAADYHEGMIDPTGPGWERNLREQFNRRRAGRFEYIELDNPDAYSERHFGAVLGAIELAAVYGLKVIAKNPLLLGPHAGAYVAHANVYGAIVEAGAGNPFTMDALRRLNGKPGLPVWFVFFGDDKHVATRTADRVKVKGIHNMGVTYSQRGEYGDAEMLCAPTAVA